MISRQITPKGDFLVCSGCPAKCPVGKLQEVRLLRVQHRCAPDPTWELEEER